MILFTSDVKKVFSLSFTKEPCKMNEDLLFDLTTFFALVSSSAAAAIYLNARNYFKLIYLLFFPYWNTTCNKNASTSANFLLAVQVVCFTLISVAGWLRKRLDW